MSLKMIRHTRSKLKVLEEGVRRHYFSFFLSTIPGTKRRLYSFGPAEVAKSSLTRKKVSFNNFNSLLLKSIGTVN